MNEDFVSVYRLIDIIKTIHDNDYINMTGDCADMIFQQKYCYYFAMMLSNFYPNGKMCIRKTDNAHIAYKIGNFLYDSGGMLFGQEDDFAEMENQDYLIVETTMLPLNKEENKRLEMIFNNLVNDVKKIYQNEEIKEKTR